MFYYAQTVYPTILREINEISQVQSSPTQDTKEKERMLLDYATTYPNAIVHYKANNMFLHADSDAAHVTITEARICYAGHFYMNYWPSPSPIKPNPKRNGPIHMEWETIRNDVSPTAESETYGTFNNRKTDIGMQPA